jgi:hypothetical protein
VRRRILTILIFATIGLAVWWASGLHFGHRFGDFDPRADENSEGQCP